MKHARRTPLTLEDWSHGDLIAFASKGHHDPHTFMAEVQRRIGPNHPLGEPRQGYYRMVPIKGKGHRMIPCQKGARGSWPATVAASDPTVTVFLRLIN